MNEAKRTTLFGKWARAKWPETFAFEAKIVKGPSMPYNAIKPHQIDRLFFVKHKKLFYKISDFSPEQKPFDGFMLVGEAAYLVIFWYQSLGDRRFTMIDVDDWIKETQESDRKSLTYERSCQIGQCLEL